MKLVLTETISKQDILSFKVMVKVNYEILTYKQSDRQGTNIPEHRKRCIIRPS